MVTLEVQPLDTLAEVQQLVERQLGILPEQQRFLVVEQPAPGVVGLVTNTVLLHSISGAKAAVGLAAWASCGVLGRLRGTLAFPITVRRENGSCATLTVVRVHDLPVHCRLGSMGSPHLLGRLQSTLPCPELLQIRNARHLALCAALTLMLP